MKLLKDLPKSTQEVLKIQFGSIGKTKEMNIIDFGCHSEDNWFQIYSWTRKQRMKFIKDLAKWIKTKKKLAQDVFNIYRFNKKEIGQCIGEWIFNRGFKDVE